MCVVMLYDGVQSGFMPASRIVFRKDMDRDLRRNACFFVNSPVGPCDDLV